MKSRCELVIGQDDHANAIKGNLREQDKREVYLSSGEDPDVRLVDSWARSNMRWTVLYDEKPIAVAGVTISRKMPEVAVPWLLATAEVEKIPKAFSRRADTILDEMLSIRPTLANYVDCENSVSIRWLEWLGFKILDPIPYGPFKAPFHPFIMVAV